MENLRDEYADGTPRPKGFEYFIEYDSVTEKYYRQRMEELSYQ